MGKKVAKVATENRQNRHMAELRQTYYLKLLGHQILCGKLVSQASFELRSPKLDRFKNLRNPQKSQIFNRSNFGMGHSNEACDTNFSHRI